MAERLDPIEPGWYPTVNGTEYWDGQRWGAGGMHLQPSQPVEANAEVLGSETGDETRTRTNPFIFGAAMALLITVVLNITLIIAVASLGLQGEYEYQFSRGGALVLIAWVVTWATCRSWRRWKAAAWIWGMISIVAAFVTVNLQVQAWMSG